MDKTSITVVKQSGSAYCVIACIASVLLDADNPDLFQKIGFDKTNNTHSNLQEIIIDKFPRQLQRKGTPRGLTDAKDIPVLLCQLGIVLKDPRYIEGDPEDARCFIIQHKEIAKRIFLLIEDGTHCIRIVETTDEGLKIMDPRKDELSALCWNEFVLKYTARAIY